VTYARVYNRCSEKNNSSKCENHEHSSKTIHKEQINITAYARIVEQHTDCVAKEIVVRPELPDCRD